MCTVTYIPKEDGGFILTQNRDEDVKRSISTPPIQLKINGAKHLFPVDPQGQGTWIGISEEGRVSSLLNGGSEPHNRKQIYRHSRGKVIMDYFSYPSFMTFYDHYNFKDLEPFTLLVFEEGQMYELIVNELSQKFNKLNPKNPYIYSSSSLYSKLRIEERRLNFLEWYYAQKQISQQDILSFHSKLHFEDELDKSLIKGEHILNTVSTTSINMSGNMAEVLYLDHFNDMQLKKNLKLRKFNLAHS